jgi:hypothetical protein
MQDELQKAYAAYQQALYLLPNPKVMRATIIGLASSPDPLTLFVLFYFYFIRRILGFGTASASFTTVTVLSIMLKKPSLPSSAWTNVRHIHYHPSSTC